MAPTYGIDLAETPVVLMDVDHDGNLDVRGTRQYSCGRELKGANALWVDQRHEAKSGDISGETPKSLMALKDTSEFAYGTYHPRLAYRKPLDILAHKTRHVYCAYEPGNKAAQTDFLPIKLEEPSPELETFRLYNFPITQEMLDIVAACPNLRRLVIANTRLGTPSAPEDPIVNIPAPANTGGMATWMFNTAAVGTVQDWAAPSMERLMLSQTGMDHIPPGLLTSGTKLKRVTARRNRIGTGGAREALEGALGSDVRELDLAWNLVEEIPVQPDREGEFPWWVCYHTNTATFGGGCDCSWVSKHEPLMLHGNLAYVNDDPEFRASPSENPPRKRRRVGLSVDLCHNPLEVGHYPKLFGKGREAHRDHGDYDGVAWYKTG